MKELPLQRPGRAAPAPTAPVPAFALWQLGFRPFYLLAGIFAALDILLWSLQFAGTIGQAVLRGPLWHAHEMLFGYALAVIAGFLLTAVRNWTNQPTPTGVPLMILAAIWVLARLLVLGPWPLAAALANAAFPIAVAIGIGVPIVRSRNRRNYFFVGLLALLGVLALVVHAALDGLGGLDPLHGVRLGLDVVLFIMVVMAGRVVPMFTNNGIVGLDARRNPLVERLSLGAVVALFVVDLLPAQALPWAAALAGGVALAAGLANAVRLMLWQPWRTFTTPLVWVLHVAYAWIVVHLLLRAGVAVGIVTHSVAIHALTVGGIGGLTLGMMTRTARGHTARPLRADRYEATMYLLVFAAAAVRVFGPLASPAHLIAFVQASAILWAGAFGLYVVRAWPVLTRPRLDGKPG
ncbi:MAG: NnrS family protein [Burkholderiaceae bacterium]|nr:NnrS family protein [Burkholderiaceae bacterium]